VRILMLAQFYPPMIGGEERHVQDLAIHLVRRGHEVAVATIWHQDLPEFELDHGVRVHRIHGTTQRAEWLYTESARRHAPPLPDLELMMELRRVVQQERPQIVHAHNWLVHSFLPLKTFTHAKLVVTLHDYSLICAKKSMMRHSRLCSGPGPLKCASCVLEHYGTVKGIPTLLGMTAMGALERAAVDMFIAVSQATALGNGLEERNLPYQIIPNFVPDTATIDDEQIAALSQLPKGDFLLFVGDLSRRKGIHILLDAYEGLRHAPPLVLIGRRLSETPTEFPPNMIVVDQLPHRAVMHAWQQCKIALIPSIWHEPFGIVALEAMAAGRPVIASRMGGLAEVIEDGVSGLLVPAGDPNALRNAMQYLLENPRLGDEMGSAAERRALEFNANVVVPRIEHIYEKLLESEQVKSPIPALADEGYVHIGQS